MTARKDVGTKGPEPLDPRFDHNDPVYDDTRDVVEQVVEVKFTTVVDELRIVDSEYGPSLLETFLLSVAKYRRNGTYTVPKIDSPGDEFITVTVEGL